MVVLLIHSGVGAGNEWAAVRERLDPDLDVLAPDLYGFGTAAIPSTPWSHAAQMRDLLDAPAVVCGASFGGQVALELAALAPDRVQRLVLLSPALGNWEWSERMRAFGAAEERLMEAGEVDGAVELNVELWAPAGHEELVRTNQVAAFRLQSSAAREPEEIDVDPAAIRASTTIITGDADPMPDFAAIGRHLAATIPDVELQVLRGAGHLLALERPDDVAAALGGRDG